MNEGAKISGELWMQDAIATLDPFQREHYTELCEVIAELEYRLCLNKQAA